MTRHPMFRRSVVFAGLFATYFLRAQDNSSWLDNFLQGSEAIRAGRYPDARRFLLAALAVTSVANLSQISPPRLDAGLITSTVDTSIPVSYQ